MAGNSNSKADEVEDKIPDAGLRAWSQCAGSFFLLFNSFGLSNSFGVFQTFYTNSLLPNESESHIAWIGSIQASLLIGLGILTGPIFDRGHRHIKGLMLVGTFLTVVGTLLTGICSELWELILAQGVMIGLGTGCLFLPSIAIIPQYFEKKRSFATGIGSSGSAIGSILFPIMLNNLFPRVGFRYSVWIMALIEAVTMVVPLYLVRPRTQPSKVRRLFDGTAWLELPYTLWAACLFVSLLGLYIPSFYVQLYGSRIMPQASTVYLLPILNGGSLFGRLIPLYLADKLGPFNVEIGSYLGATILAFAWIKIHTTAGLVIFTVLYGFFAGAATTLTAPIDALLCPNLDEMGVRMGMLLFPWAMGLLIGTPIASAFLGQSYQSNQWLGLQLFTGITLFVATLLCLATKVTHRRTMQR